MLQIMSESKIAEAAGKMIVKDMQSKGFTMESIKAGLTSKESAGGFYKFREDITTGNSNALYVDALASVIRAAVEPNMVGLELLQLNKDLMNGGGKGAIVLPKERRVVAAEVAEGAGVIYTGEGYDSITVRPTKKIAASKITWEMIKRGMISLIVSEAARCGKALARKVDSDIINGIVAVCTAGNGNRVVTGGATTRVSYNKLIDTRALIEGYDVGGFKATHLILHADDYAALCKDTDFKEALIKAPVVSGSAGSPTVGIFPQVEFFGPQKIIQSNQITSGKSLFVDSTELGTFVQESDVEVVDGRLDGHVDTEVIALQSYGIGIQNVRAAAMCEMSA